MAIIGKNKRGGLAKTGGSTPVSSSSKAPAGVDVAGRKASLATIAKTNPALAASLSPLATGGVQTKAQSEATTKAIQANRPIAPVITPESLSPQTPVSLPKPPASTPVPDLSATNAGLVGGGITTDTTGKLIVAPTAEPTADNKYAGMQSIFDSYLKQSQAIAPVNNEAIYNAQYKADQIAQKQQAVNDAVAQLNVITKSADQQKLNLENQGRGITTDILDTQAYEISRRAAVAALPIQAQIAAAQGNLDTAQSHLDTMFRIKSSDATAKYNYNTKLLDSVFDFATKVEQNKIEDLKLSENRKYTEKQEFIKAQNDALKNALGQGAPASVYNAIKNATDINSVTIAAGAYNGDVLAQKIKAKQLADLYAPKAPAKRETQVVGNQLIDTQTGEVISTIGENTTSKGLANAIASNKVENITSILNNSAIGSVVGPSGLAKTEPGLWGAAKRFFTGFLTGASTAGIATLPTGIASVPAAILGGLTTGIVNASRGTMDELTGKRQAFIGTVENMRSELTKDKLAQAKGQGITFGALSDGERNLIANAATKIGNWAITDDGTVNGKVIGYDIDENSFKNEMDTINYFTKLDAVLQGTPPADIGVNVLPDGTMWIANSDGTLTELKRQ